MPYPQMNLNDLKLCQFAARICRADSVPSASRADPVPRTDCHSTRTDPVLAMSTRTRVESEAWENHSDNEQSLVATSVVEIIKKYGKCL